MIALDGMTSFITVPNWIVMLLLEVATVGIELAIIGGYWEYRGGKLRWFEIVGLVTVANVVTAIMGLVAASASQNGIYYIDAPLESIFMPIIIAVVVVGGIMCFLSRKEENKTSIGGN